MKRRITSYKAAYRSAKNTGVGIKQARQSYVQFRDVIICVVRAKDDADAIINVGPFRMVIAGINGRRGLMHECHRDFKVGELIRASKAGSISGPAWEGG